ncbi:MAG TPA: cysteine--tRNA ligase, partial [Nitrospiria bacterium]|nr:cysteine--tRNA ligase [Nitrospiria bacterium]
MGEILITDSLTGRKEPLVPLRDRQVRMYVCGVTVYDRVHLGHARSALVFDLIFRFLLHRGYDVFYAKNY